MVRRNAALHATVLAAIALAIAACGVPAATSSVRAENEGTGASASANGGSGEAIATSRPECPARFGEHGPRCADGDDPGTCSYPEGVCQCSEPTWCGGAAPPPMPRSWTCERPRPPCPEIGTPCSVGAPSCPIDPCGFDQIACVGGTWQGQIGPRPP